MTHTDAEWVSAIRAAPDDDTARLVYADFLQDSGEDAKAELVRVQIELTKYPPPRPVLTGSAVLCIRDEISFTARHHGQQVAVGDRVDLSVPDGDIGLQNDGGRERAPKGKTYFHGLQITHMKQEQFHTRIDVGSVPEPAAPLRARESSLLTVHRADWFPVCPCCMGRGKEAIAAAPGGASSLHWITCSNCSGTGRIGTHRRGLLEVLPVPGLGAVFDRKLVEVPDMNQVYTGEPTFTSAPDPSLDPEWRLTAWACAALAAHPFVVEVPVADKSAWRTYHGAGHWFRESAVGEVYFGHEVQSRDTLPTFIWEALPIEGRVSDETWQDETAGHANLALALTVAVVARRML